MSAPTSDAPVDFSFYVAEYGGRNVREDDFVFLAPRAKEVVGYFTYGRALDQKLRSTHHRDVMRAECAVVEVLYQQQTVEKGLAPGSVRSETVGKHRIDFGTPNMTLVELDEFTRVSIIRAIAMHLMHTGMLYAGVN